jgi:hypothetical protein
MSAFPPFSQFAMNPLQREYVMIALLGAGLETRPSSYLMRKGYRRPCTRKTEKRCLGSTLLDLEGGVVSGGVSQVFEWMNVEIPSLFASVAQSTSQLFLLLVGPFILTCSPLFLTLE